MKKKYVYVVEIHTYEEGSDVHGIHGISASVEGAKRLSREVLERYTGRSVNRLWKYNPKCHTWKIDLGPGDTLYVTRHNLLD